MKQLSHKIKNINNEHDSQLSFGDKLADQIANTIGSWSFIITQAIILFLWFLLNTVAWFYHWDNYPYVLCNLFMSAEAAFSAPVIMMSQNRQSSKDRLMAEHDYDINTKAFDHLSRQEIQIILSNEKQDRALEMIQVGNNELAEQTRMLIRLLKEKR
jgi:uncharacterized membrane protein